MKKLNFSLHLKQDITSKLNLFENNFSACRFEDVFQSLFLWQQLFGACRFKNGFMGVISTSWIYNSYNKSVFQIITGRPLRGPRLAARQIICREKWKKLRFLKNEAQNGDRIFW